MTRVVEGLLALPPARQRELLARFMAAVPPGHLVQLNRAVIRATEVRLLAERQMGAFLKAMPKADGGDAQRTRFQMSTESPPTLREIGISKKQSSQAQARALMHFREVYQVFGLKGATSYQARRLAAEGKIIEVRLGPRTLRYCPESVARYRERLVGGG